jgi:hypothetical protein
MATHYIIDNNEGTLTGQTINSGLTINGTLSEGLNTIASGNYSHAEGTDTTASGDYSHSQNLYTTASGFYSHAGGSGSTATGVSSFIHSSNSTVSGDRSVVIGGQNIVGSTNDTVYMPKIELAEVAASIIMKSPDGTRYKLTIANGGTISIITA